MPGRFKVRPIGDKPDGSTDGSDASTRPDAWGVWDNAVNGWRATNLLEAEAHQVASDLEIQYDARGPRPSEAVRRVDPAQPVQEANWQDAGILDVWIRDSDQWFGRVRDNEGRIRWVPGSRLRPSDNAASREAS